MGKKPKKKIGYAFVPLPKALLRSSLWRRLSLAARCAYFEIENSYDGNKDGDVSISVRQLAEALGVSKDTASRALDELVRSFLISVRKKPGEAGYGSRLATVYGLRRVLDKKHFSKLCEWSRPAGRTPKSDQEDAKPEKPPKQPVCVRPGGREGGVSGDFASDQRDVLRSCHVCQPNLALTESEIPVSGQFKSMGEREKFFLSTGGHLKSWPQMIPNMTEIQA